MRPSDISAILVTRGDRDITPVVQSLSEFGEVVVWDNSKRRDCKVMGRFVAAAGAQNDVVYVQDDDCIVDSLALVNEYRHPEILVNFPRDRRAEYHGTGICLIGWGAILPARMVNLWPYILAWGCDELFQRECDRVFTYLMRDKIRQTEVPFYQLPYAFGTDRMGSESRHGGDFHEIRRRLKSL